MLFNISDVDSHTHTVKLTNCFCLFCAANQQRDVWRCPQGASGRRLSHRHQQSHSSLLLSAVHFLAKQIVSFSFLQSAENHDAQSWTKEMHLDLLPSFQIVKLVFSIAMDRTEPCCVGLNVTAQGHIVIVLIVRKFLVEHKAKPFWLDVESEWCKAWLGF